MTDKALRQLTEMMAALDRSILEVRDLAKRTSDGIRHHSFAPYHAYRASIDQYRALVATIEALAGRVSENNGNRARARLVVTERKVLEITIRSSLDFFFALSAIPMLPYGIKELFTQELESIHAARERLRAPEHRDELSPALEQDLEIAEEILVEVMRKAPSLLNFDTAGLVSRRGQPASVL